MPKTHGLRCGSCAATYQGESKALDEGISFTRAELDRMDPEQRALIEGLSGREDDELRGI